MSTQATPDSLIRSELLALKPYRVADARGLIAVRVEPGSAASRLGLTAGDVMLQVGATRVGSLDGLRQRVAEVGQIAVKFQRGGHENWAVLPTGS